MAKTRMINTKFWNDGFISGLRPLDRYLFLYFLTNEHTNISGVYELPMRSIVFESGLKKEKVIDSLNRMAGRVCYWDGWVYIKNFQKHQTTSSDKVQAGIKAEMAKVPKQIREKIDAIDTLSDPIIYLDSNSDLDSDQYLDSPKGDEPRTFTQSLFKGLKDLGIEIQDAAGERMKYPSTFRRKNPDVNYWLTLAKFSQSYGFPGKNKEWAFPWKGPIKLSKLYYEVRAKYEEERSKKVGAERLKEMRSKAFPTLKSN